MTRTLLPLAVALAIAARGESADVAAPILTPPALATPQISGPGVFGIRPGAPSLYAIPAKGVGPMTKRTTA